MIAIGGKPTFQKDAHFLGGAMPLCRAAVRMDPCGSASSSGERDTNKKRTDRDFLCVSFMGIVLQAQQITIPLFRGIVIIICVCENDAVHCFSPVSGFLGPGKFCHKYSISRALCQEGILHILAPFVHPFFRQNTDSDRHRVLYRLRDGLIRQRGACRMSGTASTCPR